MEAPYFRWKPHILGVSPLIYVEAPYFRRKPHISYKSPMFRVEAQGQYFRWKPNISDGVPWLAECGMRPLHFTLPKLIRPPANLSKPICSFFHPLSQKVNSLSKTYFTPKQLPRLSRLKKIAHYVSNNWLRQLLKYMSRFFVSNFLRHHSYHLSALPIVS